MIKQRLNHQAVWLGLLLMMALSFRADGVLAQGGTAFTYQGRLSDGAAPANGTYDLQFILYDAPAGGSQHGSIVTLNGVSVSDGYFTVELDFGSQFDGTAYWLDISVREGDSGDAFSSLSPRQKLTPAPYSLYSQSTAALQGQPVSETVPTVGQLLSWDGSAWTPTASAGGGTDTLAMLSCSNNQVAKWSGTAWVCANDVGGTSGTDTLATLACSPNQVTKWNGTAWVCSSDNDTLNGLVCNNNQIPKWDGSAWTCGADNSGSGGDTLASLTCTANQIARWNGSAWACATIQDNDTLAGLSCVNGQQAQWNGTAWACSEEKDTLTGLGCTNGQIAKWNGTAWACAVDATSGTGGGSDTLAGLACTNGQVAKWNGTAWACAADSDSGTITGVTSGAGLNGSGTSGAVNLSVDFAGDGAADTVARSDHNHLGETWTGSNNPLTINGNFSVPIAALMVSNSATGDTAAISVEQAGNVGLFVRNSKYGVSVRSSEIAFLSGSSIVPKNGLWIDSATETGVYANTTSTNNAGGTFVNSSNNASAMILSAQSGVNGDVEFKVLRNGQVYADGSFNGGGADFAEMLPAASGLEPGDVLAIGEDGEMVRSTEANQPTVIGVHSTKPGFLGGAHDEADLTGKIPVAVVGVVPVKVTAQNGPIKPGDMLVASDTAGHAMKAGANPATGTVIGKALSGLEAGTGTITMMVMLQ